MLQVGVCWWFTSGRGPPRGNGYGKSSKQSTGIGMLNSFTEQRSALRPKNPWWTADALLLFLILRACLAIVCFLGCLTSCLLGLLDQVIMYKLECVAARCWLGFGAFF